MAAIRLKLKRDEWTPRLKAVLAGLGPNGRRSVLGAMGDEFRGLALEQFGQNRPNRPAEWPPYSSRYSKRKGYGTPDLIVSGNLQQSFTVTVNENEAVVSANEPYAAAQQFGRPAKNLPARPYFPVLNGQLTEYAKNRIVVRIAGMLARMFKK